ncbi:MAG: hypothetical protein UW46_C0003G0009 [Candidatus Yanofskybacteria bacterium GW2011_GWF1_44_227]|uniref:Uncharacterized protein n=1 Tax=Candidatus Yanofskybacteria bacterium GW2011_GWE2_40_11 TaxID=1619033 RepID=A0A0G0QM57_9BACT|nr:MAG: hypothetical protein UT69_C0008G0048 [Candidatus Yanofskybacteria bacterium GW2011_GWE1_40_10]KKR41198.1 MAG: hypothetical protein UT75_C0001G0102 [Candidatus Yanofskybacteria bacterium GW2011_GWE2_40_11]KKT15724.1 MAG: hypothetical protein UV97_C0003G0056 [Candidatus Yanofskybacteria bacterium GW2011_GWF2_43_596]KKT53388.1 MAG: hypothetical protein UW46_C0003G0009 [Candidatus Yanofskybacteria bacterium GW2011_GWF1_44_227]OGN36199.1 MAG: hypothetical protein A2241_00425 [Candidatus Yano
MFEPQQKYDIAVLGDLSKREVRPTKNFHEWLKMWQTAKTLGELLGLLHEGFEVSLTASTYGEPDYDDIDRLIFYFLVADGHFLLRSNSPLDPPKFRIGYDKNGNEVVRSEGEIRQIVAQKAFKMLVQNFFKGAETRKVIEYRRDDSFGSFWNKTIQSERIFNAILGFFSIHQRRYADDFEIPNLPRQRERTHHEQIAFDFLMNFVELIWEWRDPEVQSWRKEEEIAEQKKRTAEIRKRVDEAKPWTIEVMEILGQLDILRKYIPTLDKASLAKLKEIAMRRKIHDYRHPVEKTRLVASLDEARFVGSRAAWLISEYELVKREGNRLEEIRSAQREIEEANERIRMLEAQKKT